MPTDLSQSYSRKPGESIYKIEPGFVYLLDNKKRLVNKAFGGLKVDHSVYLWIHAIWPVRKGQQPKKRKVAIVICYVPLLRSLMKTGFMGEKKNVQREYVVSILKLGAQKVATIRWGGEKKKCYHRFYKKILA